MRRCTSRLLAFVRLSAATSSSSACLRSRASVPAGARWWLTSWSRGRLFRQGCVWRFFPSVFPFFFPSRSPSVVLFLPPFSFSSFSFPFFFSLFSFFLLLFFPLLFRSFAKRHCFCHLEYFSPTRRLLFFFSKRKNVFLRVRVCVCAYAIQVLEQGSWLAEYYVGAKKTFYSVEFSPNFHGMTFDDAVVYIFELFEVCMVEKFEQRRVRESVASRFFTFFFFFLP